MLPMSIIMDTLPQQSRITRDCTAAAGTIRNRAGTIRNRAGTIRNRAGIYIRHQHHRTHMLCILPTRHIHRLHLHLNIMATTDTMPVSITGITTMVTDPHEPGMSSSSYFLKLGKSFYSKIFRAATHKSKKRSRR